jgi:hypothetical protein
MYWCLICPVLAEGLLDLIIPPIYRSKHSLEHCILRHPLSVIKDLVPHLYEVTV